MKLSIKRGLLYIAFLLLFVEVGLRVCFPLPELKNFGRVNYMPPALGFTSEDVSQVRNVNLVIESGPDQARFVHHLNAYGFRDGEWRAAKPKGAIRFFFVGDSFVEGEMAEDDETIPATYRARAEAAGKPYDVMNLGIMAGGIESYLELIQDATPIFKPDYVFLFVFSNDIPQTDEIPRSEFQPQYFKRYRPRLVELISAISRDEMLTPRWNYVEKTFFKASPDPLNPWSERDDLSQFASPEMTVHILTGKFNPFAVNELAMEAYFLKRPVSLEEHLSFLRDFLLNHGARLHLVYLPTRHQVTDYYVPFARTYCLQCPPGISLTGPRYREQASLLARTCEELGVPFMDLTAALEEEEARGNHLYWDYDSHMRGRGYRLVGNLVFDRWQP